jgi:hypothetical protein
MYFKQRPKVYPCVDKNACEAALFHAHEVVQTLDPFEQDDVYQV